jgi:hypothetical protein
MIYRGSKGDSSNICYKILDELLFYIYLFQGDHFYIGKKAFNEKDVNLAFPMSLIIRCAGSWEALSNTNRQLASNSVSFPERSIAA